MPIYAQLMFLLRLAAFDVVYVAENHENLHHVLVFFTTTTGQPTTTTDLIAEILPPFPEHISTGGDHLVIKSGSSSSLPLVLPARTTPGRKEVTVMQGHYEVKLSTVTPPGGSAEEGTDINSPLLDATKLESVNPSGFVCASCSLPLIQIHGSSSSSSSPSPPRAQSPASSPSPPPQGVMAYRDLPSEHWEELVEAWMCHSDQKLHDQVVKHGKAGFWPSPGLAYVGGSYLLFEESVVVKQTLLSADVEDAVSDLFGSTLTWHPCVVHTSCFCFIVKDDQEDRRWTPTNGRCPPLHHVAGLASSG